MERDKTGTTRRNVLKASATATGLLLGSSTASGRHTTGSRNRQWMGTWTASPHLPSGLSDDQQGFADQTLRLITHTSRGGDRVRVRLTNAYGDRAVTFSNATVGLREAGAALVPDSVRPLTFGGSHTVTVPAGGKVVSDAVALDLPGERDLAVSLYAPEPTGPPTTHQTARTTSYVADGDHAGHPHGNDFSSTVTSWFFLEAVDVDARNRERTVVCLGDSITDGTGSSLDSNSTYPDFLARRLNDRPRLQTAVGNSGIAGNRVLHDSPPGAGFGENALARLDRDVLAQPGASHVIFLEGINDIGFSAAAPDGPEAGPATAVSAADIIQGHKQVIERAHQAGIDIVGATLTPFQGAAYYTEQGERKRQTVNEFIRTTDLYDGVADFDRAIRDPNQPKRIRPKFDSGDNLHPSDAGYRAMANAVDLSLLKSD